MSSRILFNVTEEMLGRLSPEARAELLLAVGVEAGEGGEAAAAAAGGGGPGVYPPIWRNAGDGGYVTPPRPLRGELEAPGAPRRPMRPEGGSPILQRETAFGLNDEVDDDPDDPIHCPLHESHSQRPGAPALGPSRNSSGYYGMFSPSGNGHCTVCRAEQNEQELVNEMWRCLAAAEAEPTDDNINSVEKAVRDFDVAGLRARRSDADLVCGSLRRIRDGISAAAHRG